MSVELAGEALNRYSQNGEDGILGALFREVAPATRYFVEFGAWDGRKYSNTYNLAEQGWRGCYIEGSPERHAELVVNVPQPEIHKVLRYVRPDGPDGLDAILAGVGAPLEFDLLSIDIDSDDLAVWRGVTRYRPFCVVIEYNPTIPYDVLFENPVERNWGNSALSIYRHAESVDYRLVAATATNLIFLDRRSSRDTARIPSIGLEDVEPQHRYFWGYDGSLIRVLSQRGSVAEAPEFYRVPWAGALVGQPLPRRMRRYAEVGSAFYRLRRIRVGTKAVAARPVAAMATAVERWAATGAVSPLRRLRRSSQPRPPR